MLDHAVYPHILDAVLHFAPTASLVVLRQTCRALRERVRPLLFEHVIFLSVTSRYVYILTGPTPQVHLATLDYDPEIPTGHDFQIIPSGVPHELQYTRVMDSYADPSLLDGNGLWFSMPALHTIRCVHYDFAGWGRANWYQRAKWHRRANWYRRCRCRRRLLSPMAEVIIDHVDFTAGMTLGLAPLANIETPIGAKVHIVHLGFDEHNPLVADADLTFFGKPKHLVLVLRPYMGQDTESGRPATDAQSRMLDRMDDRDYATSNPPPAVAMVDKFSTTLASRLGCQTTIVGIERLRGATSSRWAQQVAKAVEAGEQNRSVERVGDGARMVDQAGESTSSREHSAQSAHPNAGFEDSDNGDATHDTGDDGENLAATTLKFETYAAWMARHADSPEGMVGLYKAVKMRGSQTAWEAKIRSGQ